MIYQRMKIGALRPCPCEQHAWVVLHPATRGTHVGLRVHQSFAGLLRPQDQDVAEAARRTLDGVAAIVGSLGHRPIAVVVDRENGRLRVRLRLAAGSAETDIECEPGVALLAAEHLDLPILMDLSSSRSIRQPDSTAIPEVYRETLARLGLLAEVSDGGCSGP
jgi:hypothetical protein